MTETTEDPVVTAESRSVGDEPSKTHHNQTMLSASTHEALRARREARAKLPCAKATLHATDRAFRVVEIGFRALLYLAMSAMATTLPFGPHLMTGFLLADIITWAASASFDVREHPKAVAIELGVAVLALWLWTSTTGTSLWPDSIGARMMILVVAAPVCWFKGVRIYRRRAGLVEAPWWEQSS